MAESQSQRIVLYLSPTNPFCRQVYDFFVRRKIAVTVHDVSEDPQALRAMTLVSGQHEAPVLVVDDQVYSGFDLSLLTRLFPRPSRRGVQLGVAIASAKPSGDRPGGAYVGEVKADTPADRAGVKKGDIIVEMAQQPVQRAQDVHAIASELVPGSHISLTVWRARHRFRVILDV